MKTQSTQYLLSYRKCSHDFYKCVQNGKIFNNHTAIINVISLDKICIPVDKNCSH